MKIKTRGIVLHHFKYSDNFVIACIYTEKSGRQTYMIKGIRSRNSKIRMSFLQPLTLLEMETDHNEKRNLQRIVEASPALVLTGIGSDFIRNSIALFLAEVLYKTLQEEHTDGELFDFLWNATELLDIETKDLANFHLVFLVNYCRYLGYFPHNNYGIASPIFDMKNGMFVSLIPEHPYFLNQQESLIFNGLLSLHFNDSGDLKMNHETRFNMIAKLIVYLRLHNDKTGEIKSLDILRKVFET